MTEAAAAGSTASRTILTTLAAGQFLMTLDSSVMNVSIATVAHDVGTTVTGIQTAITFYTLIMAALMITGGKLGQLLGRKRAFAIGCTIYGAGALVTAAAPNLAVLMLGWSFLEGAGAALILPAIVGLVASNFAPDRRPAAYGLVASAAAIAVAAGPVIGGFFTTYLSWRWVFVSEVVIVAVILLLARRMADSPRESTAKLDLVGTLLSGVGLSLLVLAVLRSGSWGVLRAKEHAPEWFGLSPVTWLVLAGGLVLRAFVWWENRLIRLGAEPLVDPAILRIRTLRAGLLAFFFQCVVQAGLFFVVPLFLAVDLGLSAVATGIRVIPLSITLLLAAVGVPKLFPHTSPRRIVQAGFLALFAAIVILIALLNVGSGAGIVTWPMLLGGLGIGALASQLGAVTVSAVSDERSSAVGGIQNTVTNLGASIGTALAGAVLIGTLTTSLLTDIKHNPAVPASLTQRATSEFGGGVPFLSDAQLKAGLAKAGVPRATAAAVEQDNSLARVHALQSALAVLAGLALVAQFFTRRIPDFPPAAPAARS